MSADGSAEEFAAYCQAWRQRVEHKLSDYTTYGDDCPAHLAAAIRHSLLAPAKRLRPLLVLMACEACGYDAMAALPAACAVEFIHTYSLIHDDLPAMDNDELRRGLPTCHVAYGEATAILAGDALLAQAFELIARDIQPPAVAAKCVLELAVAAGAGNLVGGQQDDLHPQHLAQNLAGLERIHRRKTGAMIEVSLRLGGLIAGANQEQLQGLSQYGQCLGLAFQIVDDLLDLGGDESKMGKKTRKDSDAGKLTYPGLIGEDASRERASRLIAEARQAVAVFAPRATHLEALARYVLERNH
ncbi:polyprenyl synthetase family protein [Anatilimnocola sp. NA78]|uniref:polyprenyl synthetase family protein n=1 Tax=Anatilimnocola sp. NA78 TaxID=3415683 RepID=UPI003CE47D98